jgi:hypothetical protein
MGALETVLVIFLIGFAWAGAIVCECEGKYKHQFGERRRRARSVTKTCVPRPPDEPTE